MHSSELHQLKEMSKEMSNASALITVPVRNLKFVKDFILTKDTGLRTTSVISNDNLPFYLQFLPSADYKVVCRRP
jgi:hypothetical protein